MTYDEFLDRKRFYAQASGFVAETISPHLFDWQQVIDRWALRKGRCAIWADCGLGKTEMQCEWGQRVSERESGDILIVAPLAVAEQSALVEAPKFGRTVHLCRTQADVKRGLNITNYEMMHEFDATQFVGVVLDESSILKAHDSATRTQLTEMFSRTPYRLCCSATPAPNDWMELATHAEFLGVMKRAEMLSMFFVHDGGDTSKWRLKRHAERDFWKWVCSWAVMLRKPSDIGFSDDGFVLPKMRRHQVTVKCDEPVTDTLFAVEAKTLNERRSARRNSLEERVKMAAFIAGHTHETEPVLVWCDLNSESEALAAAIPGAVEITGSDSRDAKKDEMMAFSRGDIRVIVSKPSICGYGMNWQHCRVMIFVGLSDSFEQVYQAERRCWRFGQTKEVQSYTITSEAEGAVVKNQERKLADFELMSARMVEHMQEEMRKELGLPTTTQMPYNPRKRMTMPEWLKEIA